MTNAVATQVVGTSNTNAVRTTSSIRNSVNTVMWFGRALFNITINMTFEEFVTSVGSMNDLLLGRRGDKSAAILLKGEKYDKGNKDDVTLVAFGSDGAIAAFKGQCEKALARREELATDRPDEAINVLLVEAEEAAKRQGNGQHQPRQPRPQSVNTVYCSNIANTDFTGASVRDASGGRFEVVNAKLEVLADGEKVFCDDYLAAALDTKAFQQALAKFKKDQQKRPHLRLWKDKKVLGLAKNILHLTSPKVHLELVALRDDAFVAEAVKLAKDALDYGRAARKAEDMKYQQESQTAWKDADRDLQIVEKAIREGADYRRARDLQDLVRLANPLVSRFKLADLAERIDQIVRPKPAQGWVVAQVSSKVLAAKAPAVGCLSSVAD
jgi:hypothetical protein